MAIPVIAAGLILQIGCDILGDKASKTVTPPAPAAAVPAAKPAPPPPEPPFSIPQTRVTLPTPQPLTEEARASIPETPYPDVTVTPQPGQQASRRPPAQGPAHREAPVETPPATPPPEAAKVQPAPAENSVVIQSIVPADERIRMEGEIQGTLRRATDLLGQIEARGLATQNKTAVSRVRSFVNLSERALSRGDIVQARNLADRAVLVAGDLLRGR